MMKYFVGLNPAALIMMAILGFLVSIAVIIVIIALPIYLIRSGKKKKD